MSKEIQTEKFSALKKVFYLVLFFLGSQACFTEVEGYQVLTKDNQEIKQNKENKEANEKLSKTNIQNKQKFVQTDKTSIKNTKGLIILSDRYSKNDFVRFYNKDGTLWYEFTFYYDDKDGKFEYENKNFEPFAFHPDYFLLALKCVGSDKNRYEVIVNEKKRLLKFVKKDDLTLKFQTWENHILQTFAVDFNRKDNPVREKPEGKEKIVNLTKEETFRPLEIRGKWLKVGWESSKNRKKYSYFGWVKWKENQKILVELFYFS